MSEVPIEDAADIAAAEAAMAESGENIPASVVWAELGLSGDFRDCLLAGSEDFDDLDLARSAECPRDIDLSDQA